MKSLIKSLALLILLAYGLPASSQNKNDAFNLDSMLAFNVKLQQKALLASEQKLARAMEVMQDNEYIFIGLNGQYLSKYLRVDGLPLDFGEFNLLSMGMLTVTNGDVDGREIPFYVYLKRDGKNVLIPGHETANSSQTAVDIVEILEHAKSGDYLVIEPVDKKGRISALKLIGLGC